MSTKFQQRHYEAIAQVFQDAMYGLDRESPDTRAAINSFRLALIDMFAHDNPLFDRARFERACVPGANVRKRVA